MAAMLVLAPLACWLTGHVNGARLQTTTASALDTYHVAAVAGNSAILPCDVTPPHAGELVYLVLWYKGDEGEPLYSYDSRQETWNKGQRWSDENQFGSRAFFQLSSSPAELRIEDIQEREKGMYRCRVDFKSAPTRNSLVNLTVITPPSKPHILEASGREVKDTAGPFTPGSVTSLRCISSGGEPRPRVSWWREGRLIDSSWDLTFTGDVQNSLQIGPLTRKDLGTVLTCQAANNNMSVPESAQVTLDMHFPPTDVAILTPRQPLSAGKTYTLECESRGSRPEPVITWWMGDRFLGKTQQEERGEGVTVSSLELTPVAAENGLSLTCRSENTRLRQEEAALEDAWLLSVYYAPMVSLKLGLELESQTLEEGSDIYLDCAIRANPPYYKIVWLHNKVVVEQNMDEGIILSGESLVLQRVGRNRKGNYTCLVSNIEGDSLSNTVTLNVKYSPKCAHSGVVRVGASLGSVVKVRCAVDAFPPATAFSWTFNNSKETVSVRRSDFTQTGNGSVLSYSAHSDRDYGQLTCIASNELGSMREGACTFQLIAAGPPQPPSACAILNQTTDLLQVECSPGFDGGLEQQFLLEVVDVKTGIILINASSTRPIFTITGLNPGRDLILRIFGVNQNGVSQPATLEGFTLKVAELQIDSESPVPLEFTPFLGMLLGIALTLLTTTLAILTAIRLKYRRKVSSPLASQQDEEEYYPSPDPPTPGSRISAKNNPDVIMPTSKTRDIYGIKYSDLPPAGSVEPLRPLDRGGGGMHNRYACGPPYSSGGGCSSSDGVSSNSEFLVQQQQLATAADSDVSSRSPLSTISQSSPRTNITVNPSESNCHSWTPLLHLHQESVL